LRGIADGAVKPIDIYIQPKYMKISSTLLGWSSDMDGMVLVSKADSSNGSGSLRTGRPKRTGFCVRRNGKIYMLGIPKSFFGKDDHANFFLSEDGFAVNISPNGERAISGKSTSPHTLIPRVISDQITGIDDGTTELVFEERPNHTWFFPFSQFTPLQKEGNALPVVHLTTLMEQMIQ
jgi:hypothetical protein